MEDVSAYLKNCFKEMHKKTMEKTYHHKNLKDRMDDYRGVRRQTRDTLLLQRRNIHENNLSPYVTPRPSRMNENIVAKSVEQRPQARPTDNRYEMLMKWKAKKEKKKQEEKKRAKPLFKVFHVPVDIGLPNLENVNKQIKGKSFTSKFAPPNHKFCAPKNITAIDIKCKRQTPLLEKNTSQSNRFTKTIQTRRNIKTKPAHNTRDTKQVINVKNQVEKKVPQSSISTKKWNKKIQQPEKSVDWNNINIVDSDGEVLTKEISDLPKKQYTRTPKMKIVVQRRNFTDKSSESSITVDALKCSDNGKAKFTNKGDNNKVETAKYKNTKVTSDKVSSNRKNPVRITRSNAKIETPWKSKEKKDPGTDKVSVPQKNNCIILNKRTFSKKKYTSNSEEHETSNSDDELSIKTSRSTKRSMNLSKTPSSVKVSMKTPIKTPHNAKQKGSLKYKERESIYSDDEISIKTPLKSPKTPSGMKNITKSSLKFVDNEASSHNELLNNTTEGKCERESIYSDDEISIKTPLKIPKTPTKSAQEIDSFANLNIEKDVIVLLSPPKMRKHTDKIVKNNTVVKEDVIKINDDECLIKTPNNVNDFTSPSPRKKSRTGSKLEFKTPEATRNNKRDTIYSDDEISIRTPLKTPKSTSKIPRTPRSARKVISTSSIDSELPDDALSDVTKKKKRKSFKRSMNESLKTLIMPDSKDSAASPVYISPFVTISRGKESARKEYKIRQSTGGTFIGTPECKANFAKSTTPKAAAEYFTIKLDTEIARLEGICDKWEAYKDQNELSEETIDTINVAIGQSKLLIAKKFQQFRSLIEECRSCQYKDKPITCQDLHGFWDMIYMQVEDLDKRFSNLDQLKANGWYTLRQEIVPVKRTRGRPRKMAVSSKLKDVIKAARSKKKEIEMSSTAGSDIVVTVQESTIGSTAATPLRNRVSPFQPSSTRRSLRVSLLSGQIQKRRAGSSPGLTMMRISQAIKCGDGLTPSKSILKTDLTRSEKRVTKSVLFKDEVEEHRDKIQKLSAKSVNKENLDSSNMISFSPI